MLFISILLAVWFGIWLMYANFIKDTGKLFVMWLNDMYADDDADDHMDEFFESSGADQAYHLSCEDCGFDWWSVEAFANFCPHCGKQSVKEIGHATKVGDGDNGFYPEDSDEI